MIASSSPNAGEERSLVARMTMLDEARELVEGFGTRHGLAGRDVLRLQLVVEELFTNSVHHGYGRECDEPIRIALGVERGTVTLLYEDAARPHDPLASLVKARAQLVAPEEERAVGGLGLLLVAGLMDGACYSREADRNRLVLTLEPRAGA